MYEIRVSETVTGEQDALWAVWSDPDRFPSWDPREVRCHLDGPFEVGTTIDSKQRGNPGGTATLTVVEQGSRWTVESPLPGGRLEIDHLLEPAGPGRVTATKTYRVHGPLVPLFRLVWGPRIRRDVPASLRALATEAARRTPRG